MLSLPLSFRFSLAFATFLFVVVVGRAQEPDRVRAGEAEMVPPAGWSLERDPAGPVVLKRTDDGQLSAIVVLSELLRGSLPEAVRDAMRRGFADAELELDPLDEGPSIFGLPAVSFDESFRHPQLRRRVRVRGVGLNIDGKLHLAWLTTTSHKAVNDRASDFERMIHSWRFKPGIAKPWDARPARRVPTELAGLYWGSKIQNRYNGLSGSMDLKAIRRYVVLLPTGQAYRGVPPGGRVLDMDFAERLRQDPEQCGVYSVEDDEIVFTWPKANGMLRTERAKMQKRGGQVQFRFAGVNVSSVQPTSLSRLEGVYTASSVTISNTAFSNTAASSERRLKLTPDGRYAKSGFVGVSFSHDVGGDRSSGAGTRRAAEEQGTYTIEGFRLTLKPDQGEPEHFTLIIETPSPTPEALFIDGAAYLKAGR